MQTISVLVANIKGGCGKTTIATHVAAAFARSGRFTVLADGDRQRSSLRWTTTRPRGAAGLAAVDWSKDISQISPAPERLVIDAPAAMGRDHIEELVEMAHAIVLPVLPSVFDESSTERFLERLADLKPIRKQRKLVAVVGNRVRANTRAAARLDRFLQGIGFSVIARLRDSQVYPEAAARGLSIFDVPGRRELEFRRDWDPLLAWLGIADITAARPAPPAPRPAPAVAVRAAVHAAANT